MRSAAERFLRSAFLAPLAAGLLLAASFPPLDLGFAAPAGWALLFASMRLRGGEGSGRQGLLAGLVFFLPTLSWIAPLVVPGWLFTALWCAAFEGLFARCLRPHFRSAKDGGGAAWVLVAPALHLLFDMVRTVLATGFPWALPGYAGWRNPLLLGAADVLGVHAATFVLLLTGAALSETLVRWIEGRLRVAAPLVPAAAAWALLAAWSLAKPAIEERPGPVVLLLQANVPQQLKEDRLRDGTPLTGPDELWTLHEDLAAKALARAKAGGTRIDVVVWPETMVPALVRRPFAAAKIPRAAPYGSGGMRFDEIPVLRVAAVAAGRPTLAGVLTASSPRERYNSVLLLDSEGRYVAHQDKQHLTPGGESLPLLDWEWMPFREEAKAALEDMAGFLPDLRPGEDARLLPLPFGDGDDGDDATTGETPTTVRCGALVCYESIFPEIPREMVRDGADAIFNLSNYGWFAGTAEMEQALAMACFRAAELRRSVVLASNNGISAVIGPDGSVRSRTGADERTSLVAEVPLASGRTAFVAVGETAAWVLGVLGALLAFPGSVRRTASTWMAGKSGPASP